MGKRAGRASPKQDHVSRLLVEYALTGAKVVRLKSGDCGLFGRLEEEIIALREAGIGYEIIPGVTSGDLGGYGPCGARLLRYRKSGPRAPLTKARARRLCSVV